VPALARHRGACKPKLSAQSQSANRLERSVAALASYRRDVILEAVAASAKELLRSHDLTQSLPKVIEQIGKAAGVDRVHLLQIDPAAPIEQGQILKHRLWSAPGISTPRKFGDGSGVAMAEVGLKSWVPRLAHGETIVGPVRSFEDSVRRFFKMGGLKSTVCVPILVDDGWWGFIGFDDCRIERGWSSTEIDTLETLAELIGAAVARAQHLKVLSDANRIIENSPTILYRFGPREPFPLVYLSQNVRRYGYSADELLATPNHWSTLIEREDLPAVVAKIKAIASGKTKHARIEYRLKKRDGSIAWFIGEGRALRDNHGRLVAIEGLATDITEEKRAAEKIEALARTDTLTGLANRAAFLDRLNLEFARARRDGGSSFAVLYLDLDHFKDVNDTLGHPIGDELLQAVAERIKACVRETDMVARFGGDEFAVLQDNLIDLGNIEQLATKIGTALAKPFTIGGNHVHTTVSIGIVPYRDDIDSTEAMMAKADLALYRAKDEGRNKFRFHVAALDQEVRERVAIGDDLRLALERGEFELHYQPQVDVSSGRVVGLEALIRWNHPTRGMLLPDAFIPIAETTGSIVAIGQWVIERTCHQIRNWRDRKIATPVVAVNLSAAQFKLASDLDQTVAASLTRYDIAPDRMELELTESVLMETTQKYSEAFTRLRQIGVRLVIDDFGTGYSSLDYLRSFHVSRLKIDRRFISDVTTNVDDATIVRAIISLADALGIGVVAEGVETAVQREFLMTAGCRFAQGHYFSHPLPVDRATELLQRNLQFAAI
jgi:diguanylate cyclase (GGDEF)-like protein/PAS domain S-box-containing protein